MASSISRAAMYRDAGGGASRYTDRKSTRLNSSHLVNSYAVFCLKKQVSSPDAIVVQRQLAGQPMKGVVINVKPLFGIVTPATAFFNDTAPTEIYTLSLHDALPIYQVANLNDIGPVLLDPVQAGEPAVEEPVLHVAADLLGADEPAVELGIVDRRPVGAGIGGDPPPRLGEQAAGGLFKAALGQAQHQDWILVRHTAPSCCLSTGPFKQNARVHAD